MLTFKCSFTSVVINTENCRRCTDKRRNGAYCKEIRKVIIENLKAEGVL